MFNNVIYFIIVLLIFNISYPDNSRQFSLADSALMFFLSWGVFAACCQWAYRRLAGPAGRKGTESEPSANAYHGLALRLSILAVLLFSLDVFGLDLRYWLQCIPGLKRLSVVEGILGLAVFVLYLCTLWFFAYPAYRTVFRTGIERRSFIFSNLRLNLAVLFPWVVLTLAYDLLSLAPRTPIGEFLNSPLNRTILFAALLGGLILFVPRLIQSWWGCRPFAPSGRIRELEA